MSAGMSDELRTFVKLLPHALDTAIIGDESDNPEIRKKSEQLVKSFNSVVDNLRTKFPNTHVSEIVQLMFLLIHHKMIPVINAPNVPTLSFVVMRKKGVPAAAVLVPDNWSEKLENDWIGECGGMVFCASQCRDFYNKKFSAQEVGFDKECVQRAHSYEAEYLLTVKKNDPSFKLNDYQSTVLDHSPCGIESQKNAYESKPFVKGPKSAFLPE